MRVQICLVVALCVASFMAIGEQTITPVKSVAELRIFLQQTPEFPLNCLSSSARQRFIDELVYNENGLAGISTAELSYGNFSAEEMQQIFAVVGYPVLDSLLQSARPPNQSRNCQALAKESAIEKNFEVFQSYVESLLRSRTSKSAITPSALNATIAKKMHDRYFSLFSSAPGVDNLAGTSTSDLSLLFRSAEIGSFYTHLVNYRRDMLKILAELERRNAASRIYYSAIYDTLVADREFIEAQEFSHKYSAFRLGEVPEIQQADDFDGSKASVLVVTADAPKLTRINFNFNKPAQVIVIATPHCHFCEYAIRDIQADPQLRNIFETHASWLAPQEQGFDLATYQQWSRDCPARMTALIYREDEWPMLDTWNTPTFYFFKQGKAVAKLSGWPEEGYKQELLAGLRQIGLIQ